MFVRGTKYIDFHLEWFSARDSVELLDWFVGSVLWVRGIARESALRS
jgi:hypothetical protein